MVHETEHLMGDLVPIYSAADAVQAQLLKEQLALRDIDAWIINEALSGAVGGLPPGWSSNARVVVASADAEKAREIAMDFDRNQVERLHAAKEPPEPAPVVDLDDWPRCLMCGERRLAVCRFCGTAGTHFPLAYQGPGRVGHDEAAPPLSVVCPTCDEPFVPRFYKECEHCGYEFEDGVPVPHPTGDHEILREDLTRVWILLGGMLLLFVACGVYLWWLMR